MAEHSIDIPVKQSREANWDLLRSLAMLFVVFVHSIGLIREEISWLNADVIKAIVILCDPIFFTLSGFFAICPSKRPLKGYYLNKVRTIILPLVLYSVIMYFYETHFIGMTLNGYFEFFFHQLATRWWFIPALVPCLVAAPFISKGFEKMTDKQVIVLGGVISSLFLWGLVFTFSKWLGDALDITSLASISNMFLQLIPPGYLTTSPAYFQFFIMGGVCRRLLPNLSFGKCIACAAIGLLFLLQDIGFRIYSLPIADPSYSWMFETMGIMALFSRLRISGSALKAIFAWTGKRSYSIYLLQYATIAFFSTMYYQDSLFGPVSDMGAFSIIGIWLFTVACAYLLALVIASIVDPLLLMPLQKLYKWLFMRAVESKEGDPSSSVS